MNKSPKDSGTQVPTPIKQSVFGNAYTKPPTPPKETVNEIST